MKYYTGIGSRDISSIEYNLVVKIGSRMAELGYCLRSGGADGADEAFEEGCDLAEGEKSIYLPWKNFNGYWMGPSVYSLTGKQRAFARERLLELGVLPWFDNLSNSSKLFHTRNYYQVVGSTEVPSRVCIYIADIDWKGEPVGGTRTAVMVSKVLGVPTYNLRDNEEREKLLDKIF